MYKVLVEVNTMTKETKTLDPSELKLDKDTKLGDLIDCKAQIKALKESNKNLKNAIINLVKIVKKVGLKVSFTEADLSIINKEDKE